jgi:uncharacterized protein YjiS (DUF1127 family)
MQATLTPTHTGFDLTAALADGGRALRGAAASLVRAWRAAHERRQTERTLRQLSPGLRRDLGLEPDDGASITRAAARRADPLHRLPLHF